MSKIYNLSSLTTEQFEEIITALKQGAVAALPTDTVYGVCVCAYAPGALNKLNKTKNNPPTKPAQVLCTMEQAFTLAVQDEKFKAVAQKYWPGALTIVAKSSALGSQILARSQTIGLRVPNSPFAIKVMEALKSPLFASSANMHGQEVCATEQEILKVFEGLLDIIVLNGNISTRPSAVIDLSSEEFKVIRSGELDSKEIEMLLSKYK